MNTVTQPLREEHKALLPHVEALREAADAVGEQSVAVLRGRLDAVYDFLAHHLIPHAEAEDRALYPVVAGILGAREATATMSRDHVEVSRLTQELAALEAKLSGAGDLVSPELARGLRRVLYGLYAVVRLHFAKEEEVYLPLLDTRLSPEEARHMFEAMERAAKEVKGSKRGGDRIGAAR